MSKTSKKEKAVVAFKNWIQAHFHRELDPIFLFHNYTFSEELEGAMRKLAGKQANFDEDQLIALRFAALAYPLGCTRLMVEQLRDQLSDPELTKPIMLPDLASHFLPHSRALLTAFLDDAKDLDLPDWPRQADFRRSVPSVDTAASPTATAQSEGYHPLMLLYLAEQKDYSHPLAALFHDVLHNWYGRKRFSRRAEQLALESRAILRDSFEAGQFQEELEQRLLSLNYRTPVAMELYESRRRSNLRDQRDQVLKTEKVQLRRKTGKDLGRGIDTLYRTAFRNHINLSRIADGKANMMISINTIILSILLAVSGAGIGFFQDLFFQRPLMLLPIITLLLSSLIAVVFAVFSARPKVTEYRIKKKKLLNSKEASLLYFGNFLKLEKSDFVDYMDQMKYQQDELYNDLSRDLYDLGKVLHRKYLLLTISYNTFVGGLALSVSLLLIVLVLKFF
ncbi:MAG: Pycsar system effector family protein [Bacteroidota bacterium]